ncbi:alpha/beta hydrolase [Bradyrhizobium manausense]|uniref:alpha/beta fold hydrolase n=1 Tax=Bradyrhizobium manausense TaxID=989370 RepID=UPI001BAA2ED0|nr:alpha/beta hydrolase [Bradyrhizobium manausense]MBR0689348.1 alpha/beta hydrolase [Bradyrhizobium manausense]
MTNWIRGTCTANGIDIHYLRTSGDKRPLLALHGLTGSGACWTPLARALQDRYDVFMPDARGHGASSAPPHGYLYRNLADDVIGLIKTLGLVAPVLLGHSMGGMTAAVVAHEMGTAIRGVILADPTFLSAERQREVYESDVAEQHRRLLGRDKDAVLAETKARQPHRSLELLELIIDARLQTDTRAFEVLTPPNPDYRELVKGIAVPSLLVVGTNGVVSVETARELQELNPRLRHGVIANAGHGLPYDQPVEFAAAVGSFLATVDAPTPNCLERSPTTV